MSTITSATNRSIVQLEEVRDYLKVPSGDSALDNFIFWAVDLASGVIEDYLGKAVKSVEVEWITDGCSSAILFLDQYPFIALVGVTNDEKLANLQYRDSDGTGEWADLVDDLDLIDTSENWKIVLLGSNYFPFGTRNIRVKYYAGWASPPADIRKVCLEMVSVFYDESKQGNNRLGMSSKNMSGSGGNASDTFMDMNPKWRTVLDKYRRIV